MHNPPRPESPVAPLVVISGTADPAIPAWASRWFLRWARVPGSRYIAVPRAGHLLFHDDLDLAWPVLDGLLRPLRSGQNLV